MKCSIMLHFIWDFTVCKSTHLGVSLRQRFNFSFPLILFSIFTTVVTYLLFYLCTLLAYSANNMDPDQTAPKGALRSKMIKAHSVCFCDQKVSGVHLNICSRHNTQTTFFNKVIAGLELLFSFFLSKNTNYTFNMEKHLYGL